MIVTLITRVEVVSNDNANEGRLGVFDLIYNFRIMKKGPLELTLI